MTKHDAGAIADEILTAIDAHALIEPFTTRDPSFSVKDSCAVLAKLREKRVARGERHVGRKIGFTNRGIWAQYGVNAPIWGDMFHTTVSELPLARALSPSQFSLPRLEPEIVFKLAKDVPPGTDEAGLLDLVEWITHGFEIVQSIYPDWRFQGADCFASEGLHGAVLLGPPRPVTSLGPDVMHSLVNFGVTISCNGTVMDRGRGANVLDGPLTALRHLVDVLARDPFNPPLRAGEIVTTGTLTAAFPIAPGEKWSTKIEGIALEGIAVEFT
jgi:2-keto-4-pentenoate hydratase